MVIAIGIISDLMDVVIYKKLLAPFKVSRVSIFQKLALNILVYHKFAIAATAI